MLIKKINGANGSTEKIRVTEEFSTLLFVEESETGLKNILVTAYIERAGKNIPLCTRLSLDKVKSLSYVIEEVSKCLKDNDKRHFFPLSFFENGNFKLNDADAFILELEGIKQNDIFSIFGIQDIYQCSALYNYEEKNMLVGEHTKTFDLKGIERICFPIGINDCEIGFVVENVKGSLVEIKMTFEEFLYSLYTQTAISSHVCITMSNTGDLTHPYVMLVDGITQLKIYSKTDRKDLLNFVFQSVYEIKGDTILSVQQDNFSSSSKKAFGNYAVENVPVIGTGSNFRKL